MTNHEKMLLRSGLSIGWFLVAVWASQGSPIQYANLGYYGWAALFFCIFYGIGSLAYMIRDMCK